MKLFIFSLLCIAGFMTAVKSQTTTEVKTEDIIEAIIEDDEKPERMKLRKDDYLMLELFNDFWQQTPPGLKTDNFNRGFNAYLMNDMPIGRSNFALGFGLGLSYHNLYSNSILERAQDSLGFTGHTEFSKLEGDYNKNKLTLMYIDLPVELRFRTRDILNSFKIAVGFKVGYNVKNYTKYEGDIRSRILDKDGKTPSIKTKEYNIQHIEKLRYGITARIGYGKYNLTAYYALTSLMKEGKSRADEMFPISIGISFTPF